MNKRLAKIVAKDMLISKKAALLKQIDKNTWEYITKKYDFEVSYKKSIYFVDIFKHDVEDNNDAYIESTQFDTLEDVEKFIKNYK